MVFTGFDDNMAAQNNKKIEFGDFQTPIELARQICSLLFRHGLKPSSIVEPTCGKGNFIIASHEFFPNVQEIIGIDINNEHVELARLGFKKNSQSKNSKIKIYNNDFFTTDWENMFRNLPEPLLIIGNPPWVTNSGLSRINGNNIPEKTNFQNHRGIEAITGKSNFDISEWMLNKLIECINSKKATLAMLCKTAVARKVLFNIWKSSQKLKQSEIYHIDTYKHFGANVDACLLVVSTSLSRENPDCQVYKNFNDNASVFTLGYRQGNLIANIEFFEKWKHLEGKAHYRWRSGIKHDCSNVMELHKDNSGFRNGFNELIDLEEEYLFPMLKSSDIANGFIATPSRWMLVPQHIIGEDTNRIRKSAPKTWQYLQKYANILDKRASTVYKKHPRFSVFGVGDYSFAQWKVAISGFYKKLSFKAIGTYADKSIVLDDTCYFITCRTQKEALFIAGLLNSDIAKEFFYAFIFWDEKRPITLDKLKRLDFLKLARELGREDVLKGFLKQYPEKHDQPLLFSENVSKN